MSTLCLCHCKNCSGSKHTYTRAKLLGVLNYLHLDYKEKSVSAHVVSIFQQLFTFYLFICFYGKFGLRTKQRLKIKLYCVIVIFVWNKTFSQINLGIKKKFETSNSITSENFWNSECKLTICCKLQPPPTPPPHPFFKKTVLWGAENKNFSTFEQKVSCLPTSTTLFLKTNEATERNS